VDKKTFPHPSRYRRLRQLLRLSRHWEAARSGDHSFAGEWAALESLLARLGIVSGCAVDIAASDGVSKSCTLGLFRNPRWSGLAIEMDPVKFAKLAYAYAGFPNVQLAKCRVTPDTVASLLKAHEIPPGFEFLNLDIDSYDLFVVKEMLAGGFRPQVISMEINEKIPPPLFFTVRFDCSATAAAETVKPFGYLLAEIRLNNALFVRADVSKGIQDQRVAAAYREGYQNYPARKELFAYNADVDSALNLAPADALAFFERVFERYRGKFEIHVSEQLV
jgi:hypothetical protein